MRAAGKTYTDVARRLGLSEAGVKRLFHLQSVSLQRLEAVCDLAGLQISDLVDCLYAAREPLSELIATPRWHSGSDMRHPVKRTSTLAVTGALGTPDRPQ